VSRTGRRERRRFDGGVVCRVGVVVCDGTDDHTEVLKDLHAEELYPGIELGSRRTETERNVREKRKREEERLREVRI
jgi:hypothetical protein